MTADQHAEVLVAFHKKLTEGGISSDAAGALTIEYSRGLIGGQVEPPTATKAEKIDEVAEAAERKRRAREEQLTG